MFKSIMENNKVKYFAYTYNYVTLHKAIIYAKEEWGIDNTFIIYTPTVTNTPDALKNGKYHSCIVDPKEFIYHKCFCHIHSVDELLLNKRVVQLFINYIIQNIDEGEEGFCFIVFRDTTIKESILIKKIKKKYPKAKIIMIEEGLGAYSTLEIPPFSLKRIVKKIIYWLLGIPTISLYDLPHGNNPLTDIIICSRPKALKGTTAYKAGKLVREKDVFSKEKCDFFLREVMMKTISDKTYDYVYLSQPLFPTDNEAVNQKYDSFLWQLFDLTSKYGQLVIKPHPLDSWDYSKYLMEKVEICPPEVSKCAYEIAAGHFGNPQAITLYSSAAINVNLMKPILFLYDFFPERIRPDIFSDQFIKDNGIVRCKTMKDVKENLSHS